MLISIKQSTINPNIETEQQQKDEWKYGNPGIEVAPSTFKELSGSLGSSYRIEGIFVILKSFWVARKMW